MPVLPRGTAGNTRARQAVKKLLLILWAALAGGCAGMPGNVSSTKSLLDGERQVLVEPVRAKMLPWISRLPPAGTLSATITLLLATSPRRSLLNPNRGFRS